MINNLDFTAIKNRRYAIVINGNVINKVERFVIRRSIQNLIDTFEITVGNFRNEMSPHMYLGDIVQFVRNGTDVIFQGRIEKKTTSSQDGAESMITITGRDLMADMFENSAEFNTFKNTTDNAIMEKIIKATGSNYTYQFAAAAKVSEYDVGPGDTVGSVLQGVANLNGFFIWRRGNTLIKAKIAESGDPKEKFYIGRLDEVQPNGGVQTTRSNVLSFTSDESIEGARSEVSGFSTAGNKSKASLKATATNAMYSSSQYQTLLRDKNGHTGSGATISRKSTLGVSGRNKGEMQREVDLMAKQTQPEVHVGITVKDFRDYDLNDILFIQNDFEGIEKNMVITGLLYTIEESGKETTEITLQLLGAYPK